jgi:flagellar motor switch protein FliG
MSEDGIHKSAILLMSLGEDAAASVLKHLAPREVQKIGAAMATLKQVSREDMDGVLDDFSEVADQKTALGTGSDEYIRSVLVKALGDDKAATLLERILHGGDTSGIEGLKWMDSSAVAELIRNEHPQIIATILVHLDRDQASEVLTFFPERVRNDVALRIATLDGVQPAALRELNEVLTKLLAGSNNIKKSAMGGVRTIAEILNFMPSGIENAIIEGVRQHDPDLAQRVLDDMFVFDDLVELDDRSMQTVLREVSSESLIIALKGSNEGLREKVFKNMSQRAAEQLKEDLEIKGPVRLSEVEQQQRDILKLVRRLAEEGQVALGGKGEDAYV